MRNTVYTQEEVEAYFAKYGYTVTEQYVNAHTPQQYVCPKGHYGKMTRANFMSGYRCPTCKAINQGNRCRYSLEFVQNYFRENDCEPLFTEYRSSSQKLKYRCVCGNITEISFAHFRSGQRCRKCFWTRRFPTGTVVASYQQRYLHRLLGGEMNYSIDWSFLDIAYPERKVYIEYDGSGHNQSVKLKKMSMSAFEEREAKRTKRQLRKGWKGIRIISTKDYLPTDGMILKQVHEGIRTLDNGSDFFEIDIDKGQIRDSKGIYNADFGELRQQRENNAVTTEIYIGDDVDTAGSSAKPEDEDTV